MADVTATWGNQISLLAKPIGIRDLRIGVTETEISRTTSTVRVTNPDDESQFVDVERIDELRTRDEYGVERVLSLNNPSP